MDEKKKQSKENEENEEIKECGQILMAKGRDGHQIHLITIIGEVEGHECLSENTKTTKYEHILPRLAALEDDSRVDGILVLLNTVGGDVEAGLAIAEMVASLSKPVVSLVLGGSHSIGVPLAVSSDYSFIVPTATMIIHPVRMNGMIIGVPQSFEYMDRIQERILSFVVNHSSINYDNLKSLMMDTSQLTKDIGSILVGTETVEKGIINEVGGIDAALNKLHEMIEERGKSLSANR